MKVIKGDKVKILSGKDRGKISEVMSVLPSKSKVLVKDINVVKRHRKSNTDGVQSGIIKKEMPIHVSNVQVINPLSGKPGRVKYEHSKDGKKSRKFSR